MVMPMVKKNAYRYAYGYFYLPMVMPTVNILPVSIRLSTDYNLCLGWSSFFVLCPSRVAGWGLGLGLGLGLGSGSGLGLGSGLW